MWVFWFFGFFMVFEGFLRVVIGYYEIFVERWEHLSHGR
jgi:hypothetical protein